MNVTTLSPDLRPAFGVVSELKAAKSPEALNTLLNELYGRKGDRLNWLEFWTLMSGSPAGRVAAKDAVESLFGLQGRDCSEPTFQAYVDFILTVGGDYSYLYQPMKRACRAAMKPEQVLSVLKSSWKKRSVNLNEARSLASELLLFFSAESASQSSGTSFQIGTEEDSLFLSIFSHARELSTSTACQSFVTAYRKTTGRYPFPRYLLFSFFEGNGVYWNEYMAANGVGGAVDYLSEVLPADTREVEKILGVGSSEAISHLSRALINSEIGKESEEIWEVWNRYQKVRDVVFKLSFHEKPEQRLDSLERLQFSLFSWLQKRSAYQVYAYIDSVFKYSAANVRNLDLIWVAYVLGLSGDQREWARSHLRSVSDSAVSLQDKVLLHKLRVHLADDSNEKLKAVTSYCSLMTEQGLPVVNWTANQLDQNAARGMSLSAGCHYVDFSDWKNRSVVFASDILGNTNSILLFKKFEGASLSLRKVRVGALVLQPEQKNSLLQIKDVEVWDRTVVLSADPTLKSELGIRRTFEYEVEK